MASYETSQDMTISPRTTVAVLFVAGCFFAVGVLLYYWPL